MEELERVKGAILLNTSPTESVQAGPVLGTGTCGNVIGSTTSYYRAEGGGDCPAVSQQLLPLGSGSPLGPSLSSGECGVEAVPLVSRGLEESAGREPAE